MPFNSKFQSDRVSDEDDAEAGVRRALGLDVAVRRPERTSQYQRTAGQNAAAHSKTGGSHGKVDVVVVQARRGHGINLADSHSANVSSALNRLQVAEAALKTERDAREHAERSLAELQKTIHELQTKIGHSELAAMEARNAAQQIQAALQAAELAVLTECQAKEAAEASLQHLRASQKTIVVERHEPIEALAAPISPAPALLARPARVASSKPVAKVKRVAAPKVKAAKPKLVKWWIKPKDAKA